MSWPHVHECHGLTFMDILVPYEILRLLDLDGRLVRGPIQVPMPKENIFCLVT